MTCDLEQLIDAVVLSPYAPAWLADTVSSLIRAYGFALPVRRSDLLDAPFY